MDMATTVNEVMTRNPSVLTLESTVQEAAKMMFEHNVGSIPLVEGGQCVGTVTDRDIALRVVGDGLSHDTLISEVAAKNVVTVGPEQPLEEAMHLMAEHQIRRLPVCDESGELVGIVAQADIARHGSEKQVGETVEQISR